MELVDKKSIYFLGIGGIGMSALAKYFKSLGLEVAGYDRDNTPVTQSLISIGIEVSNDIKQEAIPKVFFDATSTLVVYTPAVNENHPQYVYFKAHGFDMIKRAAVLGEITKSSFCLAVAGTHGKTTTSSILGHIMHVAQTGVTAFLGGITENYQSNLILGTDQVTVVEADEFDRSFLKLMPDLACITSMDADHLDIYGNHRELISAFETFNTLVSQKMIVKKGLPIEAPTYAVDEEADYMVCNKRIEEAAFHFDVRHPKGLIKDLTFGLPGNHNLSNALAAVALAIEYGVEADKIREALRTFKGVQRRFSYKVKEEKRVLIDDYAHHPTEIKAVADAVSAFYPQSKIGVVFQPHLFSRTQDFMDDFAESLSLFNHVVLLDIYPARELPIEGVNSSVLLEKIKAEQKSLKSKEEVLEYVKDWACDVLLVLGAGDIGLMVENIAKNWQLNLIHELE